MTKTTTATGSVDECPRCGGLVPGIEDPIFEGAIFQCERGHFLAAEVVDGRATLHQVSP